MHSPASLSVLNIAVRNVSSCQIEPAWSPQYQRNDIDWNAERLRPELNEIRTAISTGRQRPQDVQPREQAERRSGAERLRTRRMRSAHRSAARC